MSEEGEVDGVNGAVRCFDAVSVAFEVFGADDFEELVILFAMAEGEFAKDVCKVHASPCTGVFVVCGRPEDVDCCCEAVGVCGELCHGFGDFPVLVVVVVVMRFGGDTAER